jgi:DNA-binding response OmpR family regulator
LPSTGHTATPETVPLLPPREFVIEGRILLAEDEEAVLEFERDVLAGAGAQVVTLMNAAEVRARLLAEAFDAVIINGKLPGGWTVQAIDSWIAEKCPGLEKRLLFTFSSGAEPEVNEFLQQRNLPYLVKPFEVADLIAQARRLLQKTHAAAAS